MFRRSEGAKVPARVSPAHLAGCIPVYASAVWLLHGLPHWGLQWAARGAVVTQC